MELLPYALVILFIGMYCITFGNVYLSKIAARVLGPDPHSDVT